MRKKQFIKFGPYIAMAVVIRGSIIPNKWALPGGQIVSYDKLKEIAKRHGENLE